MTYTEKNIAIKKIGVKYPISIANLYFLIDEQLFDGGTIFFMQARVMDSDAESQREFQVGLSNIR